MPNVPWHSGGTVTLVHLRLWPPTLDLDPSLKHRLLITFKEQRQRRLPKTPLFWRRKMPRRKKEVGEGVGGRGREKPVQRNAANARERARMRILSRAFSRLKTTLPWVPADTKLSKLDTLRLATSYIAHLRALLQDEEPRTQAHPLSLTWPFSFQRTPETANGGGEVEEEEEERTGDHCENYGQYDTTGSGMQAHSHPHAMESRYFSDEIPDYDYYSSELLHIA
nr:protein Fer3-like [Penaeus vannamei]